MKSLRNKLHARGLIQRIVNPHAENILDEAGVKIEQHNTLMVRGRVNLAQDWLPEWAYRLLELHETYDFDRAVVVELLKRKLVFIMESTITIDSSLFLDPKTKKLVMAHITQLQDGTKQRQIFDSPSDEATVWAHLDDSQMEKAKEEIDRALKEV